MILEFKFYSVQWNNFIKRIEARLNPALIDKILERVAYNGRTHIVKTMPWKAAPSTDRSGIANSWCVLRKKIGEYQIASTNKVALFLEIGTGLFGPEKKWIKPIGKRPDGKKIKFLYIPLRPGASVWREGFVFGQDYILAKRVKGIKARRYLKPVSEDILKIMVDDFMFHLRAA